jgi:glycosyltransferase involved in cell wall biosynthesis
VKALAVLVPGPIDQLTGGYLYARRLVDGLRARGVDVAVRELEGRFPAADAGARDAAARALGELPDGAAAVIDGLALAGFAHCLPREAMRLRLLALVHHSLAEETGLAPGERQAFAALERICLPLFAGVVCPSARTAAAVADYGVTRVAVVLPGTMKPARAPTRRPHDGELRLLSVATVTPRKGHAVLIEALASVASLAWRLDIVGSIERDPATVASLRRAIARHGLAGRVNLAGERPQAELADAYEAADLFVLASFHEGYGMALAEALAWGLPIVATDAGAIPDTVPPGAGLLVPPGDAPALAQALARAIDDAPLRATLAAGAAAAGAALPDWDQATGCFIAAAEGVLTGTGRQPI